MTSEPATYPGYRFPAQIISHAIWLVLSGLVPTGLCGRPPSAQPIRVPLARTLANHPRQARRCEERIEGQRALFALI